MFGALPARSMGANTAHRNPLGVAWPSPQPNTVAADLTRVLQYAYRALPVNKAQDLGTTQ
jgi:hypothetical protein